jgi:hypothetical protein
VWQGFPATREFPQDTHRIFPPFVTYVTAARIIVRFSLQAIDDSLSLGSLLASERNRYVVFEHTCAVG